MQDAPLHNDLAEGPEGGRAFWIRADDGVRLRAAHWPGGDKGTVILLPGRTEYIEKYGRAAADYARRGFGTLAIDWRGQGLADRLLNDPLIGHVGRFADYQRDLTALIDLAHDLGLQQPFFLVGHSMGGCIGLRGLHNFPAVFRAAAFSGPMWGIRIHPLLRPVAHLTSTIGPAIGLGGRRAPMSTAAPYVSSEPFEDNMLTKDPEMWEYMRRHLDALPQIALVGPSLQWLREGLRETRALRRLPPPPHQAQVYLGSDERIVDTDAVRRVVNNWPDATLIECPGAEHEIMMERPQTRIAFFDDTAEFFTARA